jgi:hypothetical protein
MHTILGLLHAIVSAEAVTLCFATNNTNLRCLYLKESFLNQVVGAAITKTLRNITNGVKQTIKKPHCYAAYYNKELV